MTTTLRMEVRLDDALAEDLLSEHVAVLLDRHAQAVAADLRSTLVGFGAVVVTDHVGRSWNYPL